MNYLNSLNNICYPFSKKQFMYQVKIRHVFVKQHPGKRVIVVPVVVVNLVRGNWQEKAR